MSCPECVTPEMAIRIETVNAFGDVSDGVFWGLCEENGVGAEDLEAYYEEHKKAVKS